MEAYWPEESETLLWVCDLCRLLTSFRFQDMQWPTLDTPTSPDRGFWRVEIPCAGQGCNERIVAYTQTFGITSRRELGMCIACGQPTPRCARHHGPALQPYPLQLDFVEWIGAGEYLV